MKKQQTAVQQWTNTGSDTEQNHEKHNHQKHDYQKSLQS